MPSNVVEFAWGPGFIGFVGSMSLYGVSISQTLVYLRAFPDDPRMLKSLVALVVLLDSLHAVLLCLSFWAILLQGRINTSTVQDFPWAMTASVFTTYILTFIVHCFFSLRVWRMGKNRLLSAILATMMLVQLGGGLCYGTREIIAVTEAVVETAKLSASIGLAGMVACDIIITGSLVYYIRSKRTGIGRTEAILQKLTIYTVNTGLVGCVASCVTLISVLLYNGGPVICVGSGLLISKCYVNSFLATLNTRRPLRRMLNSHSDDPVSLPVLHSRAVNTVWWNANMALTEMP